MKRVLLAAIAAFLIIGCQSQKQTEEKPVPDQPAKVPPTDVENFPVNRTLLSNQITDAKAGITFFAPEGWTRIPDSVLAMSRKQAMEAVGQTDEAAFLRKIHMRHAFRHPTGATYALSTIGEFDTSDASITIAEYHAKLQRIHPSLGKDDIQGAVFYHNGWKVHQLLAKSAERIDIKTVLSHADLQRAILIDFYAPPQYIKPAVAAYESITGTIERK